MASSMTGGSGSNRGNGNGDRPRLTDAEKKQNHIVSEQKRRAAIRLGFDRLADLVPGMEGHGRSEAAVLGGTVAEIKNQLAIKEKVKRKMRRDNPNMSDEQFEALFTGFLVPALPTQNQAQAPDPAPMAPASNNGSSPAASSASGSKSKGKKKSGSAD